MTRPGCASTMLASLSPGRRKQSSSAAHSPAASPAGAVTAAGAGQETLPPQPQPQPPQRTGSQQSIKFSTSEIKDALRASVDESSGSPRRLLPAPFTSLMSMSPRKSSTSANTSGASPTHDSPKAGKARVSFQLSGSPARSQASPKALGRAAAAAAAAAGLGSPSSSVSPTPAPTPSDAAAAVTTSSGSTAAMASPGAASLWGLLGRKLAVDGAVHEAARQGDLPVIQALMLQDRRVADAPGDGSATPLMLASGAGHADVVTYLVANAKADGSATDLRKRTALHYLALGAGGADRVAAGAITGCILQGRVGALVDARDEEGLTALHHAAVLGRPDLIRVLLKHGADARLLVGSTAGQADGEAPMDARRLCEEQCHGVPPAEKREALRLLGEGATKTAASAEAKRAAEDGAGSLSSPSACVHACVSRLCGESGLSEEVDDELEVVQPLEHQLAPVFRRSGIPAEATELYMANLRSQGYDSVLALRHLAQDRFNMSLPKYIPDRADRKKLLKALDEELGSGATPELPPPHLPIYEFLIQLLSIPQDTALCYADALRGNMGINSGEQLLNKKYDEVAPVLVSAGILQGHRKAIKVLLKQQQK